MSVSWNLHAAKPLEPRGPEPKIRGTERLRFPSRGQVGEMLGTGCVCGGRILEKICKGRHLWDLYSLKAVFQDLGRVGRKRYNPNLQHHAFPSLG